MSQHSSKKIDDALIANPPIYSNGKYYKEMSKKFKVTQKYIKERCIELELIKIYK